MLFLTFVSVGTCGSREFILARNKIRRNNRRSLQTRRQFRHRTLRNYCIKLLVPWKPGETTYRIACSVKPRRNRWMFLPNRLEVRERFPSWKEIIMRSMLYWYGSSSSNNSGRRGNAWWTTESLCVSKTTSNRCNSKSITSAILYPLGTDV